MVPKLPSVHGTMTGGGARAEPKMKREEGRLRGKERVWAPHVQEALKIQGKEDVRGRRNHRIQVTRRVPGGQAKPGGWK